MAESRNILYFDFETTTNDTEKAFPVQIGAELVRYDENLKVVVEASMETFVNFGVPIEPEAMAATGIPNEDLEGAPGQDAPEVLQFLELASKAHYFCGYNASDFDIPIAMNVFGPETFQNTAVIDPLRLARKMYPEFPSHMLGAVAHRTGVFKRIGNDYACRLHNALVDTKVVRSLVEEMLRERNCSFDELYIFQNQVIEAMNFSFGKYKGQSIQQTLADPAGYGYVEYLLDQDWFEGKYPEEYMAIRRLLGN